MSAHDIVMAAAGVSTGSTSVVKTYATFDTFDISGSWTTSNAAKTATGNGTGGTRTNIAKASGRWYFELTVDAVTGAANMLAGMANAVSDVLASIPGITGQVVWSMAGNIRYNSTTGFSPPTWTTGDKLGIAVDMSTGNMKLYKNNVLYATDIPFYSNGANPEPIAVIVGSQSGSGCQFTANFGASTLAYTPPTGYNAGWYRETGLDYCKWDPANKGSNCVLTKGNTRNYTTSTTGGCVRGTIGKSSGKWYWEVNPDQAGSVIGMVNDLKVMSSATWVGEDANSIGWYGTSGIIYKSGASQGTFATYDATSTLGFALDASTGALAFYKDGVLQTTITLGAGTTFYPATGTNVSFVYGGRINCGESAFMYTVPSTYTGGLYTTSTITAWNRLSDTDKNANVILMGAGLSMYNTAGTNSGVRGTIGKTSGKWYWEVNHYSGTGTKYMGIATSSASLGGVVTGTVTYGTAGASYNETTLNGTYTSMSNGDILGIALDATAKTISFYVNNTLQNTITYTLSGSVYPYISTSTANDIATVAFGEHGLKYLPPAGYTAGFYS